MKTEFYWHLHHDILVEPLLYLLEERIAFIKKEKPKHEIETRLRLMRPVKGRLPEKIIKAGEECHKAVEEFIKTEEEYAKAREEFIKAGEEYVKASEECKDEIEALHAKECPNCPWDGKTIFPK